MKQLSAKLKSRGATAVVLTLALGAAVYLNWSFSREAPPSLVVSDTAGGAVETSAQAAEPITDPLVLETAADTQMMSAEETANKNYGEAQLVSVNKDSGTEFFESARLTRSKARDEALDTLKKSLKDTKLTSEEKEQLMTQLSDRISNITLETKLETLIKSKGFTDCVVNLEGSKANVTVMTESDALTAEEVTRIRDALLSQCKGLTAQDITIVEVK
ncbi:SpoIIIAH-like family protein [Gemmiger formicilis]|uniref:SpoIIIAH-like family protein n=1 Tax=Gemmiger formicilis TaxID=745368 RepID=UPI002942ED42|nr:SpoIIIAH-like family protein [Gemmiger formicilis]